MGDSHPIHHWWAQEKQGGRGGGALAPSLPCPLYGGPPGVGRKGKGAWDSGWFVLRKRKGWISRREWRALVGTARDIFHALLSPLSQLVSEPQ